MSSIELTPDTKEIGDMTLPSPSIILPSPSQPDNNDMNEKYKNILNNNNNNYQKTNMPEYNINSIDELLEKEKQYNKTEQWTKLDKTIKIQKLHQYAEKYCKDNNLSTKDIKLLKTFFTECLTKNKLNKTKDVLYDKEKRDITSIPSLQFNNTSRNYTLKNMDTKRVSTLKSLTPKKIV